MRLLPGARQSSAWRSLFNLLSGWWVCNPASLPSLFHLTNGLPSREHTIWCSPQSAWTAIISMFDCNKEKTWQHLTPGGGLTPNDVDNGNEPQSIFLCTQMLPELGNGHLRLDVSSSDKYQKYSLLTRLYSRVKNKQLNSRWAKRQKAGESNPFRRVDTLTSNEEVQHHQLVLVSEFGFMGGRGIPRHNTFVYGSSRSSFTCYYAAVHQSTVRWTLIGSKGDVLRMVV